MQEIADAADAPAHSASRLVRSESPLVESDSNQINSKQRQKQKHLPKALFSVEQAVATSAL